MLNYTYSKAIDDIGTFRVNDNNRLDRSLSTTDQPQNLTGTAVYQSPYGKGKKGSENFLVRALISDWNVSSIVTYHSGLPVAFTATVDALVLRSEPACPTLCRVSPPVRFRYANPPGGVTAAPPSRQNYYANVHHLNINAFNVTQASNVTGTSNLNAQNNPVGFGTAARMFPAMQLGVGALNTFGMGTYNVDLGLARSFPIWENVKLSLRADLTTNATNHVVFGGPSGAVASGNSVLGPNKTFSGSSTFGEIHSAFPATPR